MKLSRVCNDEIVVVSYTRHFAIAEARELKAAGFGHHQVVRVMTGEWRLLTESYQDFQQLAAAIPASFVITAMSAGEKVASALDDFAALR